MVVAVLAVLLAAIPIMAIVLGFVRATQDEMPADDEGSVRAQLSRRWDATLISLQTLELEHAIGNLTDDDYAWVREQHLLETAEIVRALDVEEVREADLLAQLQAGLPQTLGTQDMAGEAEQAIGHA